MNMQDKELDNLFRSKLDNFETEPSAKVWKDIDAGLKTGNRKRILLPLLSAAASIIVLVTVGVLLIPHHTIVATHRPVKGNFAKSNTPLKVSNADSSGNPIHQVASTKPIIYTSPAKQVAKLQPVKKRPAISQPQTKVPGPVQPSVVNQPVQQMVAVIPDTREVAVQSKDTMLLAASDVAATNIKPMQAVIPDKPIITKAAASPAKKHHIRSLGDMLNTVIAAVDKRKDKIIEFSDTDDDESTITGVNLGILVVKKQN